MPALEQGLVQVYTGEGKGKTTAALGLILRATGWQLRSYLAQFMKHQHTGENAALRLLAPHVTSEQFGRPGFLRPQEITPEDIALAHRGLERAREVLSGGEYDLVVLDEVNTAVSFGLLREEELLDVIAARPRHVELVLTGRGAGPGILAAADLVTRMVEEKHPYQRGIGARRGIEY
ncbi:MAG: cob(I)yrinic acid a,c-diamide adenosyltransferase [Anaerolineae bacterium]|nr:cob(I)yrinic acid a,c-diamide adenosyltransferase [Anaerolineae bacterium]